MASEVPVMLVLLGTDTAVELSVLTEGVEDLAGGRVPLASASLIILIRLASGASATSMYLWK